MSTEEQLPPNFVKLDVALRSIGYSFEVAVADIIDNSIDAEAKAIFVRLIITRHGHLDLVIVDDGIGMNSNTLKEAMRFGSDVSQEIDRLGKFGLGLKLASLSQAKEVHAITIQGDSISGRAWLEHGITKGFTSTVYDDIECRKIISDLSPEITKNSSGTLIWWSKLYRIGQHSEVHEHAQKLMTRLERHISLTFHRFLSGKARKAKISIDIFDQTAGTRGIPLFLDPLDPFYYFHSARDDFPALMKPAKPYSNNLRITAHIWPPNSTTPEYRLPGGANNRQGFYFYRNNRLIQGGGWNGLREVEPHSSLARIEIDLPTNFDIQVNLDVKKVDIALTHDLVAAIQGAQTKSGIDFKRYLSIADEAYRKRQVTHTELPLIPSKGIPAKLSAFLRSELEIHETKKFRDLQFAWADLHNDDFFQIDRDAACIHLNRHFRKIILRGLPGSAADAPLLKCLLFFVLEEAVSSERMSSRIRERIEKINRILIEAIRYERGI